MKKILIALLLIPVILLSGCFLFQNKGDAIIQDELGLDVSAASIDFLLNTRKDGNAGVTVVQATFSDSSFANQLQNKAGFKALPFSQDLTNILNSIDALKGSDGKLMIPIADNGYYYFDLQVQSNDGQQLSLNKAADFRVAIFDGDTNKFHYCHLGIDNMNILSDLQSLIGH